MLILTLNNGSSSFKFQIYDWDKKEVLCSGLVEKIGLKDPSLLSIKTVSGEEFEYEQVCDDHEKAIAWTLEKLSHGESKQIDDLNAIKAIGHRVVHGGQTITQSVLVDDKIEKIISDCSSYAPLHNPVNIQGIQAMKKVLPNTPNIAVHDTSWHSTMPESSFLYALPYEWYEKYGVRRYGFHGTSYLYTSRRAAVLLGKKPKDCNMVIAHIGNGASICAVKNGISVDTSMGFTPLEGLIMGSRCGDMDPAIIEFIHDKEGHDFAAMNNILNKKSGVFGISQGTTDRRDITSLAEKGNKQAKLAFEMECYRVRKYIGAYIAAVGKIDALVLTAGVAEMAADYRLEMLTGLESLGIEIDPAKNDVVATRNAETCISKDSSPVKIFVIPTDEELVMTEDAYAIVSGTYKQHTEYTYSFENKAYRNTARDKALEKDLKKRPGLANVIVNKM